MSDARLGVFARSANMAATLLAGEEEGDAKTVVAFAVKLYKQQIKAIEGLGLDIDEAGGAPTRGSGKKSSGSSKRRGSGSRSKGKSDGPTAPMLGFVRDLVKAIEAEGDDPLYSVKDAKGASFEEVSEEMIPELIEQRDELQDS